LCLAHLTAAIRRIHALEHVVGEEACHPQRQ
jgi:hypothetical protein